MRTREYKDAYGKTKKFFRGKTVKKKEIKEFIESLKLSPKDKAKLLDLVPEKYTGYAEELVDKYTK